MSPYGPGTADVLVRCDVGPGAGIGHLMRCVALAEELLARGLTVVFCADAASVPFAREQLDSRGIPTIAPVESPAEHVALVRRLRPRLVVLDSYLLPPSVYAALRAEEPTLLALVDGPPEGREADVYLDQNVGAEQDRHDLPAGSIRLAGLTYALLRDEVLRHRPDRPREGGDADPPRVLAFFGGTDAFGAAPSVLEVLAATGRPFVATVVAGSDTLRRRLERVRLGRDQEQVIIAPTGELAQVAATADVVLSAAGTSTWELACLGVAAGLVCVADNQVVGYERMLATGAAVGIGDLAQARSGDVRSTGAVARLLEDAALRDELRARAWELVDGAGRARAVDEVLGPHARRRGLGRSATDGTWITDG